MQYANMALGRTCWSTTTDTSIFTDGDDAAHITVPGSGGLAFGAVDLGESQQVAFVRLVTSVCKYLQDCFLQTEARVCVSNAFVIEDSNFKWCFVARDEQVTEEADVLMWI